MAVDPNGNIQDIGTVTSDSMGHFEKAWKPPVEGTYKILASFAGDDSYWSSADQTALGVTASSPGGQMEPEKPAAEQPIAEAQLITIEIAIIAAIVVAAVIGVAAYWLLKKRS